jgi:sugar phosphate isomerase/epimerase
MTAMRTIKGPAIFLAQFAGDKAPYSNLPEIARWAASHGYQGVQIPSWDARLIDLAKAAAAEPTATRSTESCMTPASS